MGNTEYFEMCEIISEVQCQDCLLYWEMGTVYCACGACLRTSQKNRKLKKDRFDVLSIPNYVIVKDLLTEHDTDQLRAKNIFQGSQYTQDSEETWSQSQNHTG